MSQFLFKDTCQQMIVTLNFFCCCCLFFYEHCFLCRYTLTVSTFVSAVKFSHTWTKVHTQDACYYFDRNVSYSWTESRETCKQTFHGADILHGIQRAEDYSYLKKVIHEEFQGEFDKSYYSK